MISLIPDSTFFDWEHNNQKAWRLWCVASLLNRRRWQTTKEKEHRIYRRHKENQTNTNRHNSLTSRQLVILDTSWAPWQHRMNPARLRSTHTTDSRTNTLTWRWRHGRREAGWQKGGREDGLLGLEHLCLNLCAHSVNKTCNKKKMLSNGERQWQNRFRRLKCSTGQTQTEMGWQTVGWKSPVSHWWAPGCPSKRGALVPISHVTRLYLNRLGIFKCGEMERLSAFRCGQMTCYTK